MEDHMIRNVTVFGVIFWTILFLLTRNMFHKRPFKFSGHLITMIYSLTFVFLASYTVQDWKNPVTPLASISSPLQMKILAAALGYYIYDLGRYQFDLKNVFTEDMIHHFIATASLIVGLATQRLGSEAMAAIWTGELPTSSFHLRHMLKELGYKDTSFYMAVDTMYVVSYLFGKIIGGTYLIYLILPANYPLQVKVVALTIHVQNAIWFYKIIRLRVYKYFPKIHPKRLI